MNWLRLLACVLIPPLAILDKGVRPVVMTTVLTFLGWIPGVVSALIHASMKPRS